MTQPYKGQAAETAALAGINVASLLVGVEKVVAVAVTTLTFLSKFPLPAAEEKVLTTALSVLGEVSTLLAKLP